jgi:hypothetical protein
MKQFIQAIVIGSALSLAATAFAATPPADAPAGSTGLCKDGSYSSAEAKKGACKGHKGVKEWYAASDKAADAAKDKPAAKPAAPAAAPAAATAPAAAPAEKKDAKKEAHEPAANAAPGGGPGKVWANTSTKVYHCSGDRWYGRTKAGEYLTEADAKAKGFRAEKGKACE